MSNTVYYLPGTWWRDYNRLGAGPAGSRMLIVGRETRGAFLKLTFQQQLDAICKDLQDEFWHAEAKLVAVSYGCYLFLHAQLCMPPFPGRVLLLSPVLGGAFASAVGVGFIPPRSDQLGQAASRREFPTLNKAEIHVGSEDWQSNPDAVRSFGEQRPSQ